MTTNGAFHAGWQTLQQQWGSSSTRETRAITNKLAIVLGHIILSLIAFDAIARESAAIQFLGRKGLDLIEYIKFWR
jgi:hypothetical protein